jgi:hypothetical protein
MANEIKGNPSTENVKIDGKKIKENKKNDKAVKISEYEEKNTKDLKKD